MDKEQTAIARLREAARMSKKIYKRPLTVCVSGGKDSSVIQHLAGIAGIEYEVMHNHTTADAPETVYFVRREFRRLEDSGVKCSIVYPTYKGKRTSMWSLIPAARIPPTRFRRYCCNVLKESTSKGKFIVTGVRWAESVRRRDRGKFEILGGRKKDKIVLNNDNDDDRRLFESCRLKATRVCNPIIEWSDADVYDYISTNKIPLNPLYSCGFNRVGCVGCPLASAKLRQQEFARYPKYRDNYIRAFDRMLARRREDQKYIHENNWRSAMDVYRWWMDDRNLDGQVDLFEADEFEGMEEYF